jgi:hypothetical protein
MHFHTLRPSLLNLLVFGTPSGTVGIGIIAGGGFFAMNLKFSEPVVRVH